MSVNLDWLDAQGPPPLGGPDGPPDDSGDDDGPDEARDFAGDAPSEEDRRWWAVESNQHHLAPLAPAA